MNQLQLVALTVFCFSRLIAQAQLSFPATPLIQNVVNPITLQKDTTIIYLQDYVIKPSAIDSIDFAKGIKWSWNKADNTATVIAQPTLKPLAEMKLWSKGVASSIVLKKSAKRSYEFSFDPKGRPIKSVAIAGEMNDWNQKKTPLTNLNGTWKTTVDLNPGSYQYQLVIDTTWQLDPANPTKVDNNNGGFNSLFTAGTAADKKPKLRTARYDKESFSVKFSFKNYPFSLAFYWQNYRLAKGYVKMLGDEMVVKIPAEAKSMVRSYMRVYANDDEAVGNDLLIPLNYGEVILDTVHITRSDKQGDIMYFVLVDRFNNGDKGNDKKVVHPEIKQEANYYGGDLAGITAKINDGYFKSLHINTLWVSPIVQNPETAFKEFPAPHDWYSGYHGYWPISLTQIDHRFGTEKVMKQMVADAHKDHINVLIDLVANHVHEDYPLIKKHPEWRTQLDLPDGRKNIRIWDECRLTTWFDTFLPTLDFSKPDVLKLEVDSSVYWIQKYGIDGFRHDATKHIPESFWRALTLRLKETSKAPLYQLGETYGSKELIGSYIGSGLLDGQFDFNLYFDARAAFARDDVSFDKMTATLEQSIDYYGSHHLMGNISGNHDLPRFASLAGGGLSFAEDARKAGWTRDVKVGSDSAYSKLAMLLAFINAIPGVPVIYYGDEIAMPGAGDPDNRRMMTFNGWNKAQQTLHDITAKLFGLRSSQLALQYGETEISSQGNVMIIKRSYFKESVIFIFNKNKTAALVNTGYDLGSYESQFASKLVNGKVELPALSVEIYVSKERNK